VLIRCLPYFRPICRANVGTDSLSHVDSSAEPDGSAGSLDVWRSSRSSRSCGAAGWPDEIIRSVGPLREFMRSRSLRGGARDPSDQSIRDPSDQSIVDGR
jgi:hypothetical protein